jgi:hypothetical protein
VDPTEADIEHLAARWLAAERRSTSNPSDRLAEAARVTSERYEEAIRLATREELRLASEAAKRTQADCLMGSREWAEARAVAELLRVEYLAVAEAGPPET